MTTTRGMKILSAEELMPTRGPTTTKEILAELDRRGLRPATGAELEALFRATEKRLEIEWNHFRFCTVRK